VDGWSIRAEIRASNSSDLRPRVGMCEIAGPETERVNDVWDLAVFTVGAPARLVSRGS
jgi:hypothetical protein